MSSELQTDLLNDAKIYGESLSKLPQDLYIPPDALEVYLDSFQGPLDLLLYLIRKNNIDILDIPMATLTTQYMEYVEKMKQIKLELAADYLLMSAMLIEIKSRAKEGCTQAGIGCVECKQPIIESVLKELKPIQERAKDYIESPDLVKSVVAEGCEKARKLARDTMRDVREVMGIDLS